MDVTVKLLTLPMEKLGRDLNCVCMVELACLTLGFARCPLLDLHACSQRWEALGSTQKVQSAALSSNMGSGLLSSQPAWEGTPHCFASSRCLFPARTPGGERCCWPRLGHSHTLLPRSKVGKVSCREAPGTPRFSPETRS